MKKRQGFTLPEVLVSIALLGLIAIGLLSALTGYVRYIGMTKDITEDVFLAQEKLELEIQTVKDKLRAGYISGYDEHTYSVFGHTLVGYPLSHQVDQHVLNTVVGSAVPIDLPVPRVESIDAKLVRGTTTQSGNFAYGENVNGQALSAAGTYTIAAGEPSFINKIQWYASREGFNIPMALVPSEIEIGSRYPRFPEDYEPIHHANGMTLSGLNNYIGRHIVFTVTPVAKSLKMGSTASSEPLFIGGPPVLTNLRLHLDASMISRDDIVTQVRADASDPSRILYWIKEWPNLAAALSSPVPAARQTTASKQPLLSEVSYIEDEFPGVWGLQAGAGTTETGMSVASFNPTSATSMTIILVVRADAAALNGPILRGGNWEIGRQSASGPLGVSLGSGSTLRRLNADVDLGLDAEWHVVAAVMNRTRLNLHIDQNPAYQLSWSGNINIQTSGVEIFTSHADIAEVMIYNGDLTGSDLESVKSWLLQKYKPNITPWSIRQLYPLSGTVEQGGEYYLPATVSARLVDGTKLNVAVDWNPAIADTSSPGTHTFIATAREDTSKTTILTLDVLGIDEIPALAESFYQNTGSVFTLPVEVPALFADGVTREVAVVWDRPTVSLATVGQTVVNGYAVLDHTITAQFTVTVLSNPITRITLSPSTIYMLSGIANTVTLNPVISPASASGETLLWESSNQSVARVSEDGVVRGYSKGVATITVRAASKPTIQATCTVRVDQSAEMSSYSGTQYQSNNNNSRALNFTTNPRTPGVYSATFQNNNFRAYRIDIVLSDATATATVVQPSWFRIGQRVTSQNNPERVVIRVSAPGMISTDYTFVINR